MFYNTTILTKFMLKRERTTSTAWILSLAGINFLIMLVMGFGMTATAADRLELLSMFGTNPALLAMVGPLHPSLGVYYSGFGYLYTLFMMIFTAIAVGIMNVFLVVRHTRADEEAGRYEVLRSLPSGRLANINAAMLTAVVINVILAVFVSLSWVAGMAVIGESVGFASAVIWGVNIGAVGLVFAAIAALFAQLSYSSRGASAYSFMALGLFYLLRAGADMDPNMDSEILAVISPFGLISRTWPYAGEYANVVWPILVVLAMAAVITVIAYKLCSIRDIDQGLIPARPGRPGGGVLMRSAFGLNTKLMRTAIIAWVIIMFLIAMSYGTIFEGIDDFVAGNEMYRQLMLGVAPHVLDYIDALGPYATTAQISSVMIQALDAMGIQVAQMFVNMIGFMMAMMALIPVLILTLRARAEERAMRTELIIATPTSKAKYLVSFVILTFATALLIQLFQGLGMYLIASGMEEVADQLTLAFLVPAAMAYVPALWVFGGLTLLLVGLFPKRAGWIWAYYGFTFFAMMFGRLSPATDWMPNLTPFGWVPSLPIDEWSWLTFTTLSLIGLALAALGIHFYGKRDVNAVAH